MNGPYNTPMALGREPMTAIFLVLLAPMLLQGLIEGGGYILFDLNLQADGDVSQTLLTSIAIVLCLRAGLHFMLVSAWSNWLGAGPFAGAMRASKTWLLLAVIIGPVILIGTTNLMQIIVGSGNNNWIISEGENPELYNVSSKGWLILFYVLFLAPIVEEVTFRGVAMGAMIARGVNGIAAALISTAAFTIIHGQYSPAALVVVFVAGLGFAALRLLSGTIIVPIAAHISANSIVTLLG